ncbi:helix-turn-helix domain-containing protein [Enterocloster citroniae]
MNESERLQALRKALNIKQGDFAQRISTTQGHISDIENGRKNLSERTIKLICLEVWDGKKVNEEWLRTGEGKMFNDLNLENQLLMWMGHVAGSEDNNFKKKLLYILMNLTESQWDTFEDFAKKLALGDSTKECE